MDLWTHLCYEWAPLCGANKSKMLTKILKWFYSKSYICDKLAFLWINVFFPSQNNCLLLILDGQALGKTWVPLSIIQVQRSDKMLQSTNNISIEELVPILIQGTLDAFAIVRLLFGLRFQYFPTNHAAPIPIIAFKSKRLEHENTSTNYNFGNKETLNQKKWEMQWSCRSSGVVLMSNNKWKNQDGHYVDERICGWKNQDGHYVEVQTWISYLGPLYSEEPPLPLPLWIHPSCCCCISGHSATSDSSTSSLLSSSSSPPPSSSSESTTSSSRVGGWWGYSEWC